MKYTPLHVHSDASLLDGLSQPKHMVKRLDELGLDSCAITDHGNLYNCIKFLQGMTEAKKQPILGCEFYVCEFNATVQNPDNRSLSHMLVYAKNDTGWVSLIEMVSEANQIEHFYHKPRLSIDQMAKYAGDIMVATGHLGSTLADLILEDDKLSQTAEEDAIAYVAKLQDMFGKENVWLECQLIDKKNIPLMQTLTDFMRKLSAKTGAKCIGVPDAHYCRREDAADQRILLCRGLGVTLKEMTDRGIMSAFCKSNNFHIPSYDDMITVGHTEEELEHTNKFAAMCSAYNNILKAPILPEFPCPEGYTPDEWLRQLCRDGWIKKIRDVIDKEEQKIYVERIKYELDVLQGAGLSSYFLIVRDIIQYVISKGWLPGPGRGSAAGCLISYLVDITQIDPLEYNLIFERFYNAGRNTATHISMPDIDMDIPVTKRNEVIQYIKDRYGHDKVCQMITFQTMQGRGAVKDVFRAYGMSFDEMNEITKLLPDPAKISDELAQMKKDHGESSIIKWTLENDDKGKLKEWCYIDDDGNLQGPFAKRFEQAIRLEGTKTSVGKHPAGVVIAPMPLSKMCPMVLDPKGKVPIAGLEMNDLEASGGLKFDALGVAILDKVMGVANILELGDIV